MYYAKLQMLLYISTDCTTENYRSCYNKTIDKITCTHTTHKWAMTATVDCPLERCTFITNNSSFSQQNPHTNELLVLQDYLATHSNQEFMQFFLKGLVQGFRIGFNNFINSLCSARKTLHGSTLHPEVANKYLKEGLALNRVYGPSKKSVCSTVQITRFSVIPKSHQHNKWCLIIDLSHAQGDSVNDNIPKTLCSSSYITVDDAIGKIVEFGPYTLLAKKGVPSGCYLFTQQTRAS